MNNRRGIILAGGTGTRLHPITKGISKQSLPIYDKPLIYYPISTLMTAGIKEILIISSPDHIDSFKNLLGTGENLGVNFSYKVQNKPSGIAEAFILGENFIGSSDVCLVLGDNIFHGEKFKKILKKAQQDNAATLFGYKVNDPSRFGVVEFEKKRIISLEEKPKKPKSNIAVTGLYFYPNDVVEKAKSLNPSARGELEITDINNMYIGEENVKVHVLPRGFVWLDTGTPESLLQASIYAHTVEKRQGIKMCCPEEIALENKWITKKALRRIFNSDSSHYAEYIKNLI